MIVKNKYLLLVTILNSNCHLHIAQEASELLLLGRCAQHIHWMFKTIAYASIHSSSMTLIVTLVLVRLALQTPALRLGTPCIEASLVCIYDWRASCNEIPN